MTAEVELIACRELALLSFGLTSATVKGAHVTRRIRP